jgi:ferredoxin--NADP+ reductase
MNRDGGAVWRLPSLSARVIDERSERDPAASPTMQGPVEDIEALRRQHYQATLVEVIERSPTLRIFRVRGDAGVPAYKPGQYVTLGLGYWEPRAPGAPDEQLRAGQAHRLCKRPYSVSHPILDAKGELVAAGSLDFVELYATLVDRTNEERVAPGLTPRLWMLRAGDRLHMARAPAGDYSLDPLGPTDDVLFCATGTGEAPHNAMIWSLLERGHAGRIVSVVGARHASDLAYSEVHRALERRMPRYRYLTLTTREKENADRKLYLQEYVSEGHLERALGFTLDPARTHVFLCGNPGMIGIPRGRDGVRRYPERPGLIEVLESRGFCADDKKTRSVGNIHFEEYW